MSIFNWFSSKKKFRTIAAGGMFFALATVPSIGGDLKPISTTLKHANPHFEQTQTELASAYNLDRNERSIFLYIQAGQTPQDTVKQVDRYIERIFSGIKRMVVNTAGKDAVITNEKQLAEHIRNNLLATVNYDDGKSKEDQIITEFGLQADGMKIEVIDAKGNEIRINYNLSGRELQKLMHTASK